MALRFSLALDARTTRTRSWRHVVETTDARTGRVLERKGVAVEEGWTFAWRNGIATFGPFHRCMALAPKGDTHVLGRAARHHRAQLRAANPAYRREGWGGLRRALMALVALPFHLAAAVVTILTFPLYATVWLFWFLLAAGASLALACRFRR